MAKYFIPTAHCRETGQTVKSNDLGKRFDLNKQADARREATRLAEQMTAKTGRTWTAGVDSYTVDEDGRTRL